MCDAIVIDKNEINPGESKSIRLDVGRLPSGNRINVYAHVYRSSHKGPCALLLGGVHGDEINGVEIVRSTIQENLYKNLLCGTVIAIPLLNIYGFINFSREVPDGKDLNRSFPGSLRGSLASRVARILTKKILPVVDFGIDFHTGGNSRFNHPQIRYSKTDQKARDLAIAFRAPFMVQKPVISRSLRKVCKDQNIPLIVYEGGESVRLDGFSIERGIMGLKRVLAFSGMLDPLVMRAEEIVHVKRASWIRAPHSGIFIWSKRSGAKVQKSEPLGQIFDPQGAKRISVLANRDGYIIGHNNASVVNQGDALFHLGYDVENIQ